MVQALSIRTKLIMVMLALVASVALMGVTADDAHAAVTEMRTIYNTTDQTYYVKNLESGKIVYIYPGRSASFNQWIPWCTSSSDYSWKHYIEIGVISNGARVYKYSIWQQNRRESDGVWRDRIRYTTLRGYDPNAQPIDGASTVGGWRDLYIGGDLAQSYSDGSPDKALSVLSLVSV
jgi:hypothetical protein